MRYLGDVFFDYLSQLVMVERYDEIWTAFVDRIKDSFVSDRPVPATAAMQALENVLTVSLDMSAAERIGKSWEVAWQAWDDVGAALEENARAGPNEEKIYTQVNLEAFVRVALPIYTPPHITFDLSRIQRLLAVLKTALSYQRSPDYRADVDGLMPLQSAVLEVVAVIKLDDVPGAASAVLSDLSEYLKLAFVAPFETSSASGMAMGGQRVTYVALAKEVMPHVQWLYRKYSDEASVYEQGAVERMLQVRCHLVPLHCVDRLLKRYSCRRIRFRCGSSMTVLRRPSSGPPSLSGRRRRSTTSRRCATSCPPSGRLVSHSQSSR